MIKFEWKDPPMVREQPSDYRAIAKMLIENPYQWALIRVTKNHRPLPYVFNGVSFQRRYRKIDTNTYEAYARFVGGDFRGSSTPDSVK